MTIAAGAPSGSADFTLRPVDDAIDEDDETVSVSGTAPASGLTVTGTEVTITGDDERGVTVRPTTLTMNEGSNGTYEVVLDSEPTAAVTVTVNAPSGTDVSATPPSLTFTSDDWETAQTVTVTAAEDDDAVVDDAVTITHTAASTGDYAGETAADVEVRIAELDTPTLSIADVRADEDAGGMVFTVTLSTAGSNEVTVAYATSNGTGPGAATAGEDYTQKIGSLTFAAGRRRRRRSTCR